MLTQLGAFISVAFSCISCVQSIWVNSNKNALSNVLLTLWLN